VIAIHFSMSKDRESAAAFEELLQEGVETFEELEVVLALCRRAGGSATLEQLAADIGLPSLEVTTIVEQLSRRGLLRATPSAVALDDSDPRRALGFRELQSEYEANRARVMSRMTEHALRRVRTSAIRAFARAFVLRTKDDG
jgi:hypothetical protein